MLRLGGGQQLSNHSQCWINRPSSLACTSVNCRQGLALRGSSSRHAAPTNRLCQLPLSCSARNSPSTACIIPVNRLHSG
jgi:hypothetical protein